MEGLHSSGCYEKFVLELSNHGAIVSSTLPSDEPYLKVQIPASGLVSPTSFSPHVGAHSPL